MALSCLYRFALDDLALAVRYHPSRPGLLCAGAANGKLSVFDHALDDLRGDDAPRVLQPIRCKQLAPDAMLYALDWTCDGALCIAATSAQRLVDTLPRMMDALRTGQVASDAAYAVADAAAVIIDASGASRSGCSDVSGSLSTISDGGDGLSSAAPHSRKRSVPSDNSAVRSGRSMPC